MSMSARSLVLLALAACAHPTPAPPATPPIATSPPASAPAPAAPAVAPPVFAETDPGFAFADPGRKQKLVAAFPNIDAAIERAMKDNDEPGLGVGIVIDGEVAYAKGFGIADLETKTKADGDTVYRIGSISKSFVGLAILALRDDGVLDLDDPLVKWIPEAKGLVYPTRDSRPITLRQMLSHTSGLPRMGNFDPEHNPDEATVLKSLAGLHLETTPGTQHSYSNLGFSLLGIAAAHAAHKPLHELIAERIWRPAGMTATYWDFADIPKGKLAPRYQGDKPMEPIRLGAADGAGGIYASVRDLARYAALQLSAYPPRNDRDDGPLRRSTLREAHSTGVLVEAVAGLRLAPKKGEYLVDLDAEAYGFGWQPQRSCAFGDIVHHGGAIDGYLADLRFLKDHGVGVVVMTNFGRVRPDTFSNVVLDELDKTGAFTTRMYRPNPAFDASIKRFVAVYNQWDETAYKAMLDPVRGPDPREKDELAGYKQLHGTCTGGSVIDANAPLQARVKMQCERGVLVMGMQLSGETGLITGFFGESRGVAAPPELAKAGAALAALVGKWDAAAYARALPTAKKKAADAKKIFDDLHAQHGACKVATPVHEGFDWRFELACERNGDIVVMLAQDPKDKAIVDFNVRLLIAPNSRCPKR